MYNNCIISKTNVYYIYVNMYYKTKTNIDILFIIHYNIYDTYNIIVVIKCFKIRNISQNFTLI